MGQMMFLLVLLSGVSFMAGIDTATSYTTLPDYEMAVGICVNNDGVDFMSINSSFSKEDYMELVTCINGAEFKLEPPSNY
jgi:hypothetical protein